jgi:dipeptidase E
MKLILTSSGWKYNKKIKQIFVEELKKLGKKFCKIRVILISIYDDLIKENLYINKHIKELEEIGIKRKNIQVLSNSNRTKSRIFDVIYICGGNTFAYMHLLIKSGWADRIKNLSRKNIIYFGISAGSIIAGKRIDIASIGTNPDENDVNLKNMNGLELIPFCVFPHYSKKEEKYIVEYERKNKCKVIRLREKDIIIFEV